MIPPQTTKARSAGRFVSAEVPNMPVYQYTTAPAWSAWSVQDLIQAYRMREGKGQELKDYPNVPTHPFDNGDLKFSFVFLFSASGFPRFSSSTRANLALALRCAGVCAYKLLDDRLILFLFHEADHCE
jgi:hypothetical protein